jgi:hypothetical protein
VTRIATGVAVGVPVFGLLGACTSHNNAGNRSSVSPPPALERAANPVDYLKKASASTTEVKGSQALVAPGSRVAIGYFAKPEAVRCTSMTETISECEHVPDDDHATALYVYTYPSNEDRDSAITATGSASADDRVEIVGDKFDAQYMWVYGNGLRIANANPTPEEVAGRLGGAIVP